MPREEHFDESGVVTAQCAKPRKRWPAMGGWTCDTDPASATTVGASGRDAGSGERRLCRRIRRHRVRGRPRFRAREMDSPSSAPRAPE